MSLKVTVDSAISFTMEQTGTGPIKVMHVEDYKIMRDGIEALLMLDQQIKVVGQAENKDQLLEQLAHIEVDVLLLDLFLDAMEDLKSANGFQICEIVREKYPNIKILAHSSYDDATRVTEILKAGAKGFVSKKSGFTELVRGIKTVYQGEVFICIKTAKRLKNVNQFLAGIEGALKGVKEIFSEREREILALLANGMSSREVGAKLFITERTVETHRKNMVNKVGVKNTVELMAYAASMGIVKKY